MESGDKFRRVDGTHFTDLGMMRYAEWITPILKKHMLKLTGGRNTDCSLIWNSNKNRQVREISYPQVTDYRKVAHHGPAVENSHMIARIYMNGNGGIWLWDGEKAIKPVPTGRLIARDGKTAGGAWIEVIAEGVEYKGDKVDISIKVETSEKSRWATVTARELNKKKVQFLTGVNYPSGAKTLIGKNSLAAWGVHPADVSKDPIEIGGALKFNPSDFLSPEKNAGQLQIISKPTDRISTSIMSASLKEDEVNSADKLFKFIFK